MKQFLYGKQTQKIARILVGCCIFALGLNLFILPLGLYSGGIVGLAQLLALAWDTLNAGREMPINIYGVCFFLLNVPVLALAWAKLGRSFFLKTIVGTLGISAFSALIPQPQVPLVSDPAVAIIIGGTVTGFGIGLMLTSGGSGGGIEVLGVWLSRKNPAFSVGKLSGGFNIALYVVYFFLFDHATVIYSLLYMVFYSIALDKAHYQNINARVTVFTKRVGLDWALMRELNRGVTEWDGCGAYTSEGSHILVTIVNKYEIDEAMQVIRSIDPEAFVVVDEGIRVYGNFQKRL